MELFAIKHIPSGNFLPMKARRKGFSHDEPEAGCVPRLFTTKTAARLALSAWLKGKWTHHESFTDTSSEGQQRDEWLDVESVESRKPEEMKVVQFSLVEYVEPKK